MERTEDNNRFQGRETNADAAAVGVLICDSRLGICTKIPMALGDVKKAAMYLEWRQRQC